MGMTMLKFKRHALSLLALSALLATTPNLMAQTNRASAPITLNFVNADIESVARALASLTKRSLVVDPRVKGTINLSTDKPVAPDVAWNQFLAVLRLQGFAMIETQGLYKILPEAEAKLQGGLVAVVPAGTAPNNAQVMTQIFKLTHENANNLVSVLRPLISPNNTINVTPGSNALVITDYADNLQRLGRIIASLDVANATDVEVIPLQHAIANDMAALLTRLVDNNAAGAAPAAQGQTDTGYKTTILAESRSNAIIIRSANPAKQAQIRTLLEKLDRPGSELASGNIHVVYLKNADATKLANTLRAALAGTGGGGGGGASPVPAAAPAPTSGSTPGGSATLNLPTTGGQIQADTATNSLIITASEPQYRQLRAVIDSLDQRRAQVMVESLIVEVDSAKESQFGIQWQNLVGGANSTVGILGTNFATSNLLNLAINGADGKALPGQGLNVATARNVNGKYIMTSLANFLQTNGGSNILSRPSLLTLDNEEAKIVVGQNVPFVTGQYTNNNSSNGAVNPFQTVERKDVGLTLKVKPQISDTGMVKLTIFQEVSSVDTSKKLTDGLITNKRSIESNILVEDGTVVVLGGLLSDSYQDSRQQVPGLGDIPFFGALFRNESRNRSKTNLMVFLRPVVVRDDASAEVLSNGRYQFMQGLQKDASKESTGVLPVPSDVTLPPLPAPTGTPSATPATPAQP
jgi:general secretion pathway protein D